MAASLTLVLLLPLVGVIFGLVFGRRFSERAVGWTASLLVGGSFIAALISFIGFVGLGPEAEGVRVLLFEWISAGTIHIDAALWLDSLSAVMILAVSGVAFLIHIYSIGYMHGDEGFGRYFTYLNLFTFAMLLLVLGDNLALLFVGWEGVGLCSYLLIGFWFTRESAADAGQKAFIVNRIGDAAFILGLLSLFALFGTLDIQTMLHEAPVKLAVGGTAVTIITLLLFIGATGKSAQLPLHIWLPDAMEGPTPVSALIHAATMVTAGVYLVARMAPFFLQAPITMAVVATVGAVTALMAGTIAVAQNDIKRLLAYSTISQLGFMFLALGAGAFAVGIFHLVTHAFFKALLFMGAGSVMHALANRQDMHEMGGLKRHLPVTHATMLVAGMALAGIPVFSGFFSKDEILYEAWAGPFGSPLFWLLGAITAFITGLYIFRMLYLTFYGESRVPEGLKPHESPPIMTVPLLILAALSTVAGFIGLPRFLGGGAWIQEFVGRAVGAAGHAAGEGAVIETFLQVLLMVISVVLAVAGLLLARRWYGRKNPYPEVPAEAAPQLWKILRQKYFIDEFYFLAIVKPLRNLSKWLYRAVDVRSIDGAVYGTAQLALTLARAAGRIQVGHIGIYAMAIAGGAAILLIWLFV
jgi:NADH-quinone oxidoreductase subunit L